MTDQKPFIETNAGKLAVKFARSSLYKQGVPDTHESDPCVEDFILSAASITVPTAQADKNYLTSPEVAAARAQFEAILRDFLANFETEVAPEDLNDGSSGGLPASRTSSAKIQVQGMEGSAQFKFQAGCAGPSAGPSSGGAAEEEHNTAKRQRLGMSDPDLARACTIMDMPAARVTPQFLMDKPLDVRLYTPLLVELYTSVRKMAEGISLLAKEVYTFEGDFLELSPTAVAALPTTPWFDSCDTTSGSRLLHRMETIHTVAAQLRAKNLRCQRGFWLANHTPGCNWDTWEQLCHREDQDAGADLCNPNFTPLVSWDEQVRAAIAAARQEAAALSKDGKTLLGPILPRLLARHNGGRGNEAPWRSKGTSGPRTGDKPPGARVFTPRRNHPGTPGARKTGAPGKENRQRNAASAPAAAKPPAARQAAAQADV